jgi:hypothetical protein
MSGFVQDVMIGKGTHGVPEPMAMVKTLDTMPLAPVPLRSLYLKRPSLRLWNLK